MDSDRTRLSSGSFKYFIDPFKTSIHVICCVPLGSETCRPTYDFSSRVSVPRKLEVLNTTRKLVNFQHTEFPISEENGGLYMSKQLFHCAQCAVISEYKMLDRVLLVNVCFYIGLQLLVR